MSSPEAAISTWVAKEVSWWCHHRTPETILIVLTDGDIVWAYSDDSKPTQHELVFPVASVCGLPMDLPKGIVSIYATSALGRQKEKTNLDLQHLEKPVYSILSLKRGTFPHIPQKLATQILLT